MSQLHSIHNTEDSHRHGDIVFVHGLGGNAFSTWHPKNAPQDSFLDWIAEEIPTVGVWSLEYDASPSKWRGTGMPLQMRAANFVAHLHTERLGCRPIVFIAHSLGGLVVKQSLRKLHDAQDEEFLRATKAVVFLATPHTGSAMATLLTRLGRSFAFRPNPVVENLRDNDPALMDLNEWYRDYSAHYDIASQSYCEEVPTKGVIIVDRAAANPGIRNAMTIPVDADHISICKPASKNCLVFKSVAHFAQQALSSLPTEIASASESKTMRHPPVERCLATPLPQKQSSHFVGRSEDLAILDNAWSDPASGVLVFGQIGGGGKTSLVRQWIDDSARISALGVERVFVFSFYDQGSETTVASGKAFLTAAWKFFRNGSPRELDAWKFGHDVADAAMADKSLIVLDGLETLQATPSVESTTYGELLDRGVEGFLTQFANAGQHRLCVITTRLKIALPLASGVEQRTLKPLSTSEGARLLELMGVRGTEESRRELAETYDGHPLSLTLVGNLLTTRCEGEPSRHDTIIPLTQHDGARNRVFKVLAAYDDWLRDKTESTVMRVMALFDRPVDRTLLHVLRSSKVQCNLLSQLRRTPEGDWNAAIHRLEQHGLVFRAEPDCIDTHPLIREFCRSQLIARDLTSWKHANQAICEHLEESSHDYPETLEELVPLYRAAMHGCRAGQFARVANQIYVDRIQRGSEYYSISTLGAVSEDLGLMSHFFSNPWHALLPGVDAATRATILRQATYCLRRLGRNTDAIECGTLAINDAETCEDWKTASINAENIAETLLITGQLQKAADFAAKAIVNAERQAEPALLDRQHRKMAVIQAWSGCAVDALQSFDRSSMYRNSADLKLSDYESCLVAYHHAYVLESSERYEEGAHLLESAVAEVPKQQTLGLAMLKTSLGRFWIRLGKHEKSVNLLREAVQVFDELRKDLGRARALLGLAEVDSLCRDGGPCRLRLQEVKSLLEKRQLKLLEPEYLIIFAQLMENEGNSREAARLLKNAKQCIEGTGGHMHAVRL